MTQAPVAVPDGAAPSPPLQGIRVLAVEGFIAGPYATMWLADMGAEVIKVEPPGTGEPARSLPPIRGEGEAARSFALMRANRNKKSLALDLKTPEGLAVLEALVNRSDVLVDNLRPGALERLGLPWARLRVLNPRLIYTTISGFGHADLMPGPYTERPAFDVVGQAMGGLMLRPERDHDRPVYLGFPVADLHTATVAVCGTLQALYQRTSTGVGQRVDVAMYDSTLVLNELALHLQTLLGVKPAAGLHALSAPFGAYRARDGFVSIAVLGDAIWRRFCTAIGRDDLADDPTMRTGIDRNHAAVRLTPAIEGWLATRDRHDAVAHLVAHGVPAAPVQDVDEITSCPQVGARDMLMELDDPTWGRVRVVGQPIKASGASAPRRDPPPALGAHTDDLLRDLLGYDPQRIDALRRRGIV